MRDRDDRTAVGDQPERSFGDAQRVLPKLAFELLSRLRDRQAQLARGLALLDLPEYRVDQIDQRCHDRLRADQRPPSRQQLLAERVGRRRLAGAGAPEQEIGGPFCDLGRPRSVIGGDLVDRLGEEWIQG